MNFEIFSLTLDKSANAACKILCLSSLENSINLRSQNSTSHKTLYFHQTAQNNEELGRSISYCYIQAKAAYKFGLMKKIYGC